MAPCSFASRVIPRITDSVKPCVRRAVRMTAKDTVLTGSLDGGQFAGCEVPPQAIVRPAGSGPRASRVGPSFDTRKMPRRVRASPLGPNPGGGGSDPADTVRFVAGRRGPVSLAVPTL